MPQEAYVERMVIELTHLMKKVRKLEVSIRTKQFRKSLSMFEKTLMLEQMNAMQIYANTLNVRISQVIVHPEDDIKSDESEMADPPRLDQDQCATITISHLNRIIGYLSGSIPELGTVAGPQLSKRVQEALNATYK